MTLLLIVFFVGLLSDLFPNNTYGVLNSDYEEQIAAFKLQLGETNLNADDLRNLIQELERLPASANNDLMELSGQIFEIVQGKAYFHLAIELVEVLFRVSKDEEMLDASYLNTKALYEGFASSLSNQHLATLKLYKGLFLNELNRYDEAVSVLGNLSREVPDGQLHALAQANMARSYAELGRYQEAVQAGLKAVAWYRIQQVPAFETLYNLYNNLSGNYAFMLDYDSALDASSRAFEHAQRSENQVLLAEAALGLGSSLNRIQQYEKATEYLNMSQRLAKELEQRQLLARVLISLGNVFLNIQQFDDAVLRFQEAAAVSKDLGLPYGVALSTLNTAIGQQLQGDCVAAIANYKAAKEWFEANRNERELMTSLEGLAQCSALLGFYAEAFYYKTAYTDLYKVIFDESNQRVINELRTRYDTELKEQELALSRLINAEQQNQIKLLSVILILLLIGAASGISFLGYRNRSMYQLYERSRELLDNIDLGVDEHALELAEEQGSTEVKFLELYTSFITLLEKERLYKDDGLSIKDMAHKLATNERYLSAAISEHSKTNFNGIVNFYRIVEARRLLDTQGDKMIIQDLMKACGYRSATTFYNAFNKYTGMSPKKYLSISKEMRNK